MVFFHEADEPANLSETPDPSVSFGSEAASLSSVLLGVSTAQVLEVLP